MIGTWPHCRFTFLFLLLSIGLLTNRSVTYSLFMKTASRFGVQSFGVSSPLQKQLFLLSKPVLGFFRNRAFLQGPFFMKTSFLALSWGYKSFSFIFLLRQLVCKALGNIFDCRKQSWLLTIVFFLKNFFAFCDAYPPFFLSAWKISTLSRFEATSKEYLKFASCCNVFILLCSPRKKV